MVLFEKQRGRVSPSQWHRDQQESVALLWLGEGIQPARSAWYNFRQRLSPFLERWNQQILHLAIVQGITAAMEAVTDGTLIAASASRHRLLNQEQMTTRLKALEAACEADLENQPLEKKVAGWP